MNWGFATTAFGGSLVEFVEAAIIVVAAAATAGWAPALYGTLAATGILVVATGGLGFALLQLPIAVLRGVIGALLLLFGVKWLTKATYRLGTRWHHASVEEPGDPRLAFATAFNGVLLEGAEVVFIVLALGATGKALGSAVIGAVVAVAVVIAGTVVARGPLSRIPDVVLKFIVGIMLTSFGTLWLGEALGIRWWGSDASVLWLAIGNLALNWLAVAVLRRGRGIAAGAAQKVSA